MEIDNVIKELGYVPRELETFLIKLVDEKSEYDVNKYLEENIGIRLDTYRNEKLPDNFYPFARRCYCKSQMHQVGFLKRLDGLGAIYIEYALFNDRDEIITNKYKTFSEMLRDLIVLHFQHTVEEKINNWECWLPLQKFFGDPIKSEELFSFAKTNIEEIVR
ncbi:hypothetical protein EW093_00760 [Thiospirochaeta perfilievii]|uniref:Uncharacterized protein n=1 Tax=Thiospirochaeta perfilievii TaxID=252967 RepID=A0A5C1Q5I3_9SPIO|nr:hypothetical protein [Thiospirochaeta perfilievii]QEN03295.1 hypothetical protein EW093_00760 [Thiospirochaeta perfilievii]